MVRGVFSVEPQKMPHQLQTTTEEIDRLRARARERESESERELLLAAVKLRAATCYWVPRPVAVAPSPVSLYYMLLGDTLLSRRNDCGLHLSIQMMPGDNHRKTRQDCRQRHTAVRTDGVVIGMETARPPLAPLRSWLVPLGCQFSTQG